MRWSLVCGVWGTGGTEWHLSVTLPSNFRRFADSNSDSGSGSDSGPHRRFCLLQHCCTDDCPDDFFSREFGIWEPLLYCGGGGLDPHGQKWSLKQNRPWPLLHLGRWARTRNIKTRIPLLLPHSATPCQWSSRQSGSMTVLGWCMTACFCQSNVQSVAKWR